MAQFTVQGRLKPLFNGDGMLIGFEPKDPRHHHRHKLLSGSDPFPLRFHKRKLGLRGSSSTRLSASSSSPASKSYHFNSEASLSVGNDGIYDDSEGTAEFERDELSCFRGLVLDISYRPVNVVCWKRAICLEFMEKADVLEYYDQTVNSPSGSFYIPAVLRNLTIDHVLPIARGGEWTWENLVTACSKCNSKKGQKTLDEAKMNLLKVPKAPKDYDILSIPLTSTAIKMLRMRKGTPEEWLQYL
ncbi:hypothetical protein CsSME_00039672 [Camellia sinensis var. sinensis]